MKLDDDEYRVLAALAAARGTSKSQVVRDAIRGISADHEPLSTQPLSRTDALELLAVAAKDGSVTAATALARELRIEPVESDQQPLAVGTVKLRDLPLGALRSVK